MSELTILYVVTFIAGLLGPWLTWRYLLVRSRSYLVVFAATMIVLLIGAASGFKPLFVAWLLFCVYGLCLGVLQFMKQHRPLHQVAILIPFTFSIISSLWFFAATNGLGLLGYNEAWSLYAAIHSAFFGWIFNGSLIRVYETTNDRRYLIATYANLALFLLVAFGIDGSAILKKIGVVGVSLAVPVTIAVYAVGTSSGKISRVLTRVSLLSIFISMSIAAMNEFWAGFPKHTLGLPTMVWSHGLLNALITVPCFLFAVHFSNKNEAIRAAK